VNALREKERLRTKCADDADYSAVAIVNRTAAVASVYVQVEQDTLYALAARGAAIDVVATDNAAGEAGRIHPKRIAAHENFVARSGGCAEIESRD
jgi:hypothetical protein